MFICLCQLAYVATSHTGVVSETPVLKVLATDVDDGVNGRVSYKMIDSPKSSNQDLFRIGPTDGLLVTNVGRIYLDREVRDKYKVIVQAYDGGTPRLAGKQQVCSFSDLLTNTTTLIWTQDSRSRYITLLLV